MVHPNQGFIRKWWGASSQGFCFFLSAQGMDTEEGTIRLISDVIHTSLNIEMSVLMGANIAKDVAHEDFCECTIGREGGRERQREREGEREK